MSEAEIYLGDGLYASFDGWHVRLRAPRMHGDDEVFLEPKVWGRLVHYVESLARRHTPGEDPTP